MTPEEKLAKLLWEAGAPRSTWEEIKEMAKTPAAKRFSSTNSAEAIVNDYLGMARKAIAEGWHL